MRQASSLASISELSPLMTDLTARIQAGSHLSTADARAAAAWLLDGPASDDAIAERAAFLGALAQKGETPEEITAFAELFLERAIDPCLRPHDVPGPLIDLCGTGGDRMGLFNVSTTAMFPLAAAGAVVVKHGNRAITSRCGGADVLEALGIRIDQSPAQFSERVQRTGLGFLFAPLYHPAFQAAIPVRKLLATRGQRSVFNILGPLLNPVRPPFQLTGVFARDLTPAYAEILTRLGRRRAWAVHGTTDDGQPLDELSTLGPSLICETLEGAVRPPRSLHPSSLSLAIASASDLAGGDASDNARILVAILDGSDRGPKRDLVLLNAGAALVVCGLAPGIEAGIHLAATTLDDGSALRKLRALQAG